jgi:putative transposase
MPWRTICPMDERMQFIGEWLKHEEAMVLLCQRYAISRKTGYKLLARYAARGPEGLREQSRAPHHQALAVTAEVERAVVELRGEHPRWGPRKLRACLQRHAPGARWPAASTIGRLLRHHGLTIPRRLRRRCPPATQPFGLVQAPNDAWSADFKGWFCTQDGARCLPLTVTDNASRFLLRCQAVRRGDAAHVRPLFEAAFREYGVPRALRTDNGPPFASTGVGRLSPLGVWWIKLGIQRELIAPGHPEQNGRHERFHLTLAQETAQPPQANLRAQQQCFDRFRQVFNEQRPHEALGQRPPATVYTCSPRVYPERLPEVQYAADYVVRRVRYNGAIKWQGQQVYVNHCLQGEPVGLQEVAEDCWRLWFGPVPLGWLDSRRHPRREPSARRRHFSTPKLLPMCPV